MDRVALEQLLADGLSLAEIGKRFGLHESTVGYWVKKHGLEASHRERHAARGGLRREDLEPLVKAGMSSAQIAEAVCLSKTTVRHWLREYGLKTQWAERRRASKDLQRDILVRCAHHGTTVFRRRSGGGYRCTKCRAEAVARRRRKVKQLLVDDAGGRCCVCGYNRFHRRARVSSSRTGGKELLVEPSRRGEVAGEGEGGGEKVRASMRQLPRRGRGRPDHVGARKPVFPTMPRRSPFASGVAQSGVAQFGRCARLLIERLWVRVPPPELLPRNAGPSARGLARPAQSENEAPVEVKQRNVSGRVLIVADELGRDHARRVQCKALAVERKRTIEISYSQRDHMDARFHGPRSFRGVLRRASVRRGADFLPIFRPVRC
jgi:transposase